MEKVLLIDDDEELCELVSEYLGVEGFDIDAVNDGESARQGSFGRICDSDPGCDAAEDEWIRCAAGIACKVESPGADVDGSRR